MAIPKNAGSYLGFGDVLAPNGLPAQGQISYVTGTSDAEYLGWASTGAATSDPVWRIKKLIYGAGGNAHDVVAWKWPNGTSSFEFSWDNRAALSYS